MDPAAFEEEVRKRIEHYEKINKQTEPGRFHYYSEYKKNLFLNDRERGPKEGQHVLDIGAGYGIAAADILDILQYGVYAAVDFGPILDKLKKRLAREIETEWDQQIQKNLVLESITGSVNNIGDLRKYYVEGGKPRIRGLIQKKINKHGRAARNKLFVFSIETEAQDLRVVDSNFFDIVLAHSTFEYIPDALRAYAEALRVLKPGGKLYAFRNADIMARFENEKIETAIDTLIKVYWDDHVTLDDDASKKGPFGNDFGLGTICLEKKTRYTNFLSQIPTYVGFRAYESRIMTSIWHTESTYQVDNKAWERICRIEKKRNRDPNIIE